MRASALLLLLVWITLFVLPAMASGDHGSSCCSECKDGYCLMKKGTKATPDQSSSTHCHQTQKKKDCQMRSTGCGHDSTLSAFWFKAIVIDADHVEFSDQKGYLVLHSFSPKLRNQTITHPPRQLL